MAPSNKTTGDIYNSLFDEKLDSATANTIYNMARNMGSSINGIREDISIVVACYFYHGYKSNNFNINKVRCPISDTLFNNPAFNKIFMEGAPLTNNRKNDAYTMFCVLFNYISNNNNLQ